MRKKKSLDVAIPTGRVVVEVGGRFVVMDAERPVRGPKKLALVFRDGRWECGWRAT